MDPDFLYAASLTSPASAATAALEIFRAAFLLWQSADI